MAQGRKTGGRKAGTPNRVTRDVVAVLHALGTSEDGKDLHMGRLHQLTLSDDEHVAVKALGVVLAYRYGKPTERHEHTGADGGPITTKVVFEDAVA